jgi:hypothetical protein
VKLIAAAAVLALSTSLLSSPVLAQSDQTRAAVDPALLRVQAAGRNPSDSTEFVKDRVLRQAAKETLKRGYDGFSVLHAEPRSFSVRDVWISKDATWNPSTVTSDKVPGLEILIRMHKGAPPEAGAHVHQARDVLRQKG